MAKILRMPHGFGMVIVVLLLGPACTDPHDPCTDALAADDTSGASAQESSGAVEICRAVWDEARDSRSAVDLARALVAESRYGEALALVDEVLADGKDFDDAQLASLHRSAASAALRLGDEERSKREYAAALDRYQRIGDDGNAGKCHYGLLYLEWRSSNLGRALVHADAAAAAARRAGDGTLETKALGGLLALQYDLGDLPGAWRTLKAARARADPDDATTRARSLIFKGTLLADEGRQALAVDAFQRALALATGEEESAFFRSIHLNLSAALLELGRINEASSHLAAAREHAEEGADPTARASLGLHEATLELARGRPEPALRAAERALEAAPIADWRWQLQELTGRALEALGEVDEAEAAYLEAMAIVEEMRTDLDYGELRSWLLDARRRPHERLFLLQIRDGRLRDALATLERAKARSLLDAFVRSTRPAADAPAEQTARRLEGLRDLLPVLSSASFAHLAPLDEVLAATAELDVLIYFETPDGLWAVTVYGGRPGATRLARSSRLDELIDAWVSDPSDPAAARSLGELLLPAAVLPPPGRRLHVVADGRVGEVSLAALPLPEDPGRHLIDRHELIYGPSLNALAALQRADGSGSENPAVVLGDPLGDLPGARREAERVAGRLGVEAATGADADLSALIFEEQPSLLHLATHVSSGPEGPWLALADGRLTAAELVAGGSAPRLVVLAGCGGAARRGRGLWGSVAAGFLAAGSSTVLASLWSIDDGETLRFIERFYEEGGADDPVGATARAQRHFQRRGEPAEHWAPFVVLGAWRRPSP